MEISVQPPEREDLIKRYAEKHGIPFEVLKESLFFKGMFDPDVEDMQEEIRRQDEIMRKSLAQEDGDSGTDEILTWINEQLNDEA